MHFSESCGPLQDCLISADTTFIRSDAGPVLSGSLGSNGRLIIDRRVVLTPGTGVSSGVYKLIMAGFMPLSHLKIDFCDTLPAHGDEILQERIHRIAVRKSFFEIVLSREFFSQSFSEHPVCPNTRMLNVSR